jgi:hypothetical protein
VLRCDATGGRQGLGARLQGRMSCMDPGELAGETVMCHPRSLEVGAGSVQALSTGR